MYDANGYSILASMLAVRTFYYKVTDMQGVIDWWKNVFDLIPHKQTVAYSEFKFENVRIGFVLNDFGDVYGGNRGIVMFNVISEKECDAFIEKAVALGGKITSDNRDSELKSVVLIDPFGNEFELGSLTHD